MRIVVTAGPTREYIDDVRFISNPSSGKMGYLVAAEALRRGHKVELVTGPVCLEAPPCARVCCFESVDDLYRLARRAIAKADCLIMAAAVGDYRPKRKIPGKHKKGASFALQLVAVRDVLASLSRRFRGKIFVGFAVEVKNAVANARKKVKEKALDMLVLNTPVSFGADRAEFTFVFPNGETRSLGRVTKAAVAVAILDVVEGLLERDGPPAVREKRYG